MRVLWNFGQNASNDQEGQQQGAQSRVPVSPVDEVGGSDPQEKAEPGGDPQPDTGKEADSKTTRGGNKAPLLRTQKIKAAKEGGGVEHPIKKKAASASKDGRLKTTGLEKAERRTRSQARCSSPRPASRKRRAVTTLDHQRKVNSVASSTKPAKMVSSTNTNNSNARRLTSGGTDNERSGSQWRYYDVRQVDEDVRQDPDDPVEEPPELLHAENNPESARGDTLLSPTSFANRAVGLASEGAASTSNSVLDARLGDSSSGPTSASVAVHDDFAAALKKRGLEIQEQDGDGNCLFRAISLQVYGDASMHGDVRKKCMDFMERDQEHFAEFVTGEPFSEYVARKRLDGVHGNNPEIQAISELFNRPIEVFTPETGSKPLNIFHAEYKTGDAPIRLSYHDGNHYNAVIDPLVPTAGLGLGLPGLQPGLADKMQMAKAMAESDAAADNMELQRILKESEDDEIQRKMKESEDDELQRALKLSRMSADSIYSDRITMLSDMDATYEQLEQAALEESLRYVGQGEKKRASTRTSEQEMRDDNAGSHSLSSGILAHAGYATGSVAAASAASMPSAASLPSYGSSSPLRPVEEYSSTVQELVMNGFELRDVLKAYDLVGDNFDDMLSLLLANAS